MSGGLGLSGARIHGMLAEFGEPEPLVRAARSARERGYRRMDAYTPFPVEELPDALGAPRDRMALITLIGGIAGGSTGFLMQWYASVIAYPIDVAGRPLDSWPAFVPVTFELTVLGAALAAAFGMLALNRLPRLHHPVFGVPGFGRASKDRFFLCIESADPLFEPAGTRSFLASLGALSVSEVPHEE